MNRIVSIVLSHTALEALSNALFNAGHIVGRRESHWAQVFLKKDGDDCKVFTTFDDSVPIPWALLVGSARWSVSKGEFVVSKNDFLDSEYPGQGWVVENLEAGIASGMNAYDEAVAANDELEALDKKAVVRFDSEFGTTAYFLERADAEAWTKANAAEHSLWSVVWVHRANDSLVKAMLAKWKEDGGPELRGLWNAFVSKKEVSDASTAVVDAVNEVDLEVE